MFGALADLVTGDAFLESWTPAPALAPSAPGMPDAPHLPGQPWSPQQRYAQGLSVAEGMAAYAALYGDAGVRTTAATASAGAQEQPFGLALAQLHGRYLLTQTGQGLGLLDLQAAQERLAHARLRAARAGIGLHAQPLLVPLSLSLSVRQREIAARRCEALAGLGFELSLPDDGMAELRSAPALLADCDHAALLPELLEALADAEAGEAREEERVLATMAIHAGRRPPRLLTLPEMNALLREMESPHNAAGFPGARTLWRQVPLSEIGRGFEQGE